MSEVPHAIMAKMDIRIVDGSMKQQVMKDKIFALENEKIDRERVEDMESEP